MRLLLAQGANPTLAEHVQHKTCLHYAAQVGWASCCAVLLSDATYFRGTGQLLRNVEMQGRDASTRRLDSRAAAAPLHAGRTDTAATLFAPQPTIS